jgi:hypothetical protein
MGVLSTCGEAKGWATRPSAILSALRRNAGGSAVSGTVIERIQELVLTWSVNVRPGLAALGVPKEVLNRADRLTSRLARLTSGSVNRNKVFAALGAVWKFLHEQILLEVARIPPAVLASVTAPAPAALFPEISDLPNQLVPYAVQGWSEQIKKFLRKNPFGQNVFIMVSYRARLEPLIDGVKEQLINLHLNPVLARDHSLTNDLYNPIACLLCCSYGVAIFDRAETAQMHNPNVVYELGMMQLLKRRCVILKHTKLKRMPTDLLSMLYEDYSSQREAVRKISEWWTRSDT